MHVFAVSESVHATLSHVSVVVPPTDEQSWMLQCRPAHAHCRTSHAGGTSAQTGTQLGSEPSVAPLSPLPLLVPPLVPLLLGPPLAPLVPPLVPLLLAPPLVAPLAPLLPLLPPLLVPPLVPLLPSSPFCRS